MNSPRGRSGGLFARALERMSRITKDLCGMLAPKRPAPSGGFVGPFLWFRTLRLSGPLLLLEHPRDRGNFVAFGFGTLHFLSRNEWLREAGRAGFELEREFSIIPFVRVFLFRRPL